MATQTSSRTQERLGLMRLEVDDEWSTSDFAGFLSRLDLAVRAIWTVLAAEFAAPLEVEPQDWRVISVVLDPQDLKKRGRKLIKQQFDDLMYRRPGVLYMRYHHDRIVIITATEAYVDVIRTLEHFGYTIEDDDHTIQTVWEVISALGEEVERLRRPAVARERLHASAILRMLQTWLDPPGTVERTERDARIPAPPLVLRSVHMGSPGWIEVIQSLNPLKVVESLITRWRHENTLRAKQADAAEAARRDDQLELLRVMMAHQLEVLKQMNPQLREDVYAPQLLETSLDLTRALAEERRLKRVKVVELEV